ncbi:MAG: hypothetical protein QG622_723 [Actinomycetota bacterium]|nr:hypothetical protein [Actinomycetota bacterium]
MAADLVLAVGYTLLLLLDRPAAGPAAPVVPGPVTTGLVLVTGLAPAARRLAPVPVLAAVLAATVIGSVTGAVHDPFLATAFVLYLVVQKPTGRSRVPLTWLLAIVGVLLVFLFVTGVDGDGGDLTRDLAVGVTASTVAVALGRTAHARRRNAARHAEQLARHAVLAERLRIAREMHDVVTHSLGLIAVKAGVANHVADRQPQEARAALEVIEATSREALAEMRGMLGVLRDDGHGPGLGTLPGLAERARAAGVAVTLRIDGADAALDPLTGLSVHRLVQEALTNVVTHAPGARCEVTVEVTSGAVTVEVRDDGPAGEPSPPEVPPLPPGGRGLRGMRERIEGHGGVLTTGPRPDGGFGVRATIPLPPAGSVTSA